MEYLRLGDLKLTSGDGVTAFEETVGYNYVQIEIATGKPVLQAIGETLSEITLNISLRAALGHDIAQMLRQIDMIRRGGAPQKFVFADGVYKGDYVISRRDVAIIRTDARGTIMEADFTLTLLEYTDRVVINNRNAESRPVGESSNRQTTKR